MAKKAKKTAKEKSDSEELSPDVIITNLKTQLNAQKEEYALFTKAQEEKISRLENEVRLEKKHSRELMHALEVKDMRNRDLFEMNEMDVADKKRKMKTLTHLNMRLTEELDFLKANLENHKKEIKQQEMLKRSNLEKEIASAETELARVKEYQLERTEMKEEIEELKEQVQEREMEMYDKLTKAKAEHEQNQKELKEQLLKKLHEKQSEMIKLTDHAVGLKTKKAIQRNEVLRKEISIHTTETTQMLQENQKWYDENRALHREKKILEENFGNLLKKSIAQQQTIKTLSRKISQLDEAFRSFKEREFSSSEKLEGGTGSVLKLKEQLEEKEREMERLRAEFSQQYLELEEKKQRTESEKKGLENIFFLQDETARFLTNIMKDMKQRIGVLDNSNNRNSPDPWTSDHPIPSSLDNLDTEERISVLRFLLSKLHQFDKAKRVQKLTMNMDDNKNMKSFSQSTPRTRLTLPSLHSSRGASKMFSK